jgi:CMP-N,N'-diacetyllegionaminic acid synthase
MIAIIPARGGSKGLPGKNIKPLRNKPLIGYTIEACLKAKAISRIVISTDDMQIAKVARELGAEVPFMRPASLATDDAKAIDTYLYTIDRLEKQDNNIIENIAVLLPTCPLRTGTDIDNAIAMFEEKAADSVVSYTEEHHPISWNKILAPNSRLIMMDAQDILKNRQQYEKTYYPNGAIYIFKKDILRKGIYYTDNSYAYVMPRNRSIDIDTQEDFELAEFYLDRNDS